jgi:tRNA 2-thiocytidine biosynthesis protein TtcA
VVRPLAYIEEKTIEEFVREAGIPVFASTCPALTNKDQKRRRIKALITNLETEIPQLRKSMRHAMGNVQPRHLWDLSLK